MNFDTITQSDALVYTQSLPDESVNCVITSPPYYNLRDYGVTGQIGLEDSPQTYIARLTELFHEIRRVLRSDGTCWINMGDSYANASKWGGASSGKQSYASEQIDGTRSRRYTGMPDKNLIGAPWRLAFALQDDGWILRSDVIWHKPNPLPESIRDRPTKSHEYVFLLTKSPSYYYDADAISEPAGKNTHTRGKKYRRSPKTLVNHDRFNRNNESWASATWNRVSVRNKRSVWTVPTEPTPYAHFATFPQALITPMVLAGCPPYGVVFDPFMGSGTVAIVSRRYGRHFIGSELNPEYVAIANNRLASSDPLVDQEVAPGVFQPSLFQIDVQ